MLPLASAAESPKPSLAHQQQRGGDSRGRNLSQLHHEEQDDEDPWQYQDYHAPHPEAHLYESVSAEPLTFEPPPSMEEQATVVDRAWPLVEKADDDVDEEDYDWIIAAEEYHDGEYGTVNYDSNNNFIPDFETGKYHTEGGDYEMLEGGGDEEEEEKKNEYENSNNIAAYDDNEAAPLLSRRLRRRLDNPNVEDKYLTKKDSFRDESIPIVSVI